MDARYSDYVYSYTRIAIVFLVLTVVLVSVLNKRSAKHDVATVGKTLWNGKFPLPVKKNQLIEHSVFWYVGNAFVLWAVALYAVRSFLPEFDIISDNSFSIG